MARTRSGSIALFVGLFVAVGVWPAAVAPPVRAAVVAWPPSTLVVSEVQTGGLSASDEFVELANQGAGAVDLAGLEVIYATSSGTTVTRKATWTVPTTLEPGRRVLVANAAGVFASIADLTYSGGFAATGGGVALRVVGGTAIDAVGWGDATSAFVEGTAAAASPAGSSLERAPGGAAGNGWDTNDNVLDWFAQVVPTPQGLAAAPVPAPGASPDPSATPTATPAPSATSTPTATPRAQRVLHTHAQSGTDRFRSRYAGAHAGAHAHAHAGADADGDAQPDRDIDTCRHLDRRRPGAPR
jgi:hypothetical protein